MPESLDPELWIELGTELGPVSVPVLALVLVLIVVYDLLYKNNHTIFIYTFRILPFPARILLLVSCYLCPIISIIYNVYVRYLNLVPDYYES